MLFVLILMQRLVAFLHNVLRVSIKYLKYVNNNYLLWLKRKKTMCYKRIIASSQTFFIYDAVQVFSMYLYAEKL